MTTIDYEAGYLQGISEMHAELRRLIQDPDTPTEGKLELLHMLSYAGRLISLRGVPETELASEGMPGESAQEREA